MKKIYVDQVSKIEKWESDDGKLFNSEADCKKWEESYNFTINQGMKNVPHVLIGAVELFPYSFSDDAFLVIAPRNQDDVFVTNAWLNSNYSIDSNDVYLTLEDVGKTKTIYINCCDECYFDYAGSYKNILAEVIKRFGTLQKKIEEEIAKKTNN